MSWDTFGLPIFKSIIIYGIGDQERERKREEGREGKNPTS